MRRLLTILIPPRKGGKSPIGNEARTAPLDAIENLVFAPSALLAIKLSRAFDWQEEEMFWIETAA